MALAERKYLLTAAFFLQVVSLSGEELGCFHDVTGEGNRALELHRSTTPKMSQEFCKAKCLQNLFTYAGLEYGRECWCGDKSNFDRHGTAECSMTCEGNRTQICGDNLAISVLTVCPVGQYGIGCSKSCHCESGGGICYANDGKCVEGSCVPGWKGESCHLSDCSYLNGGCEYGCRDAKIAKWCYCGSGHITDPENFTRCVDYDECAHQYPEECQICNNTPGNYTCSCRDGYHLIEWNKCKDLDECEEKPCDQKCINTEGGFICECNKGFSSTWKNSTNLCVDEDECSSGTVNCEYKCNNTIGSYVCLCPDGFSLSLIDQGKCEDINECLTNEGGCHQHCRNTEGGFDCFCDQGYHLVKGYFCEDHDECDDTNGHCQQECINYSGGYNCSCYEGYEPTTNVTCQDINECDDEVRCTHYCRNTMGGYHCMCPPGLWLDEENDECFNCGSGYFGLNCSMVCHCEEGCNATHGKCLGKGTCLPGFFGHACSRSCPVGTFGLGCDQKCHCARERDCDHINGLCLSGECASGYYGPSCQESRNNVIVAVGTLVAIFLIFAAILIYFYLYARGTVSVPKIFSKKSNYHDIKLKLRRQSDDTDVMNFSDCSSLEEDVFEEEAPQPQPVFGNVPVPHRIPVLDFETYVEETSADALYEEYDRIPFGQQAMCNAGKHPSVRMKNRFRNILPYDHSRVKLNPNKGLIGSDYINASYIKGYLQEEMFIATHGPNTFSVGDFWRMVLEQEVACIVMVTNLMENLKKKCEKYWPDEKERQQFDDVIVTNEREQQWQDFIIRLCRVQMVDSDAEPRTVMHCQFRGWPDHGVPKVAGALIGFQTKCREYITPAFNQTKPVVVHCSAGVGRTGTFIAFDWLQQQAKHQAKVDPFYCVQFLRENRMNMVQTFDQYEFVHKALSEALLTGNTIIKSKDLEESIDRLFAPNQVCGVSYMQCQFRMLQKLCPPFTNDQTKIALKPMNSAKNRTSIFPGDANRVILTSIVPARTDYINAIHIRECCLRHAFVACEWPIIDTVVDFWRMIIDYQMPCIVTIEDEGMTDFPQLISSPEVPIECYNCTITVENVTSSSGIFLQELIVSRLGEKQERENIATTSKKQELETVHKLTVVRLKWPEFFAHGSLQNMQIVNDVLQTANNISNLLSPTVVVCRDGRAWTGIFIALLSSIESLRHSGDADVYNIVQRMKLRRPEFFIQMREYEAIFQYLKHSSKIEPFPDKREYL